jgi:hypothetical protein
MITAHKPSFLPCMFHPRSIHLLCHLDSPSAANLPCLGLQQQTEPKVSRLCGSYRVHSKSPLLPLGTLSPRERHSQAKPPIHPNSNTPLTWRECFTTGHRPYTVPNYAVAITHKNTGTDFLKTGSEMEKWSHRNGFGTEASHTSSISDRGCTRIPRHHTGFSVQNKGESGSFGINHRLLVQYRGIHGFSQSQT